METTIAWLIEEPGAKRGAEQTFATSGVDSDQLAAAVTATEKMLNAQARSARPARTATGRGGRARAKGARRKSSARTSREPTTGQ